MFVFCFFLAGCQQLLLQEAGWQAARCWDHEAQRSETAWDTHNTRARRMKGWEKLSKQKREGGVVAGLCGQSSFLLFPCSLFVLICLCFRLSFSSWEIFTRGIPWEDVSSEQVQRRVCGGERLPLPDPHESQVEQVLNDLITVCWAQSIRVRPHFKDVSTRLDFLGFGQ